LVHASGASNNNNDDQEITHVEVIHSDGVYSSNMNGNDLELRVQQEKRRLDKDIDQEQVTKKRKDRSTMSISGAEEANMDSPNEDDSGNDDNGPLDTPLPPSPPTEPSSGALLKITSLIQDHELHSRWQTFITNTLASETAVQSTPLGGYNNAQSDGSQSGHSHRPSLLEPGDFSAASSAVGGLIVGGDVIDMDDADLDIAASMMEALSLPPAGATTGDGDIRAGESGAPNRRHHRSGSYNSTESSSNGRFGTVIEQPTTSSASDYFYHDPLGRGRQFDDDDDSDEELETPPNDDGGKESGSIFDVVDMHSSDSDSDGKDGSGEEDDDVPVMDLFAGNFSFGDQANTEGNAGDSSNTGAAAGAIPTDSDGAWSNFANFDDAFASSAFPEPAPIGPTETEISVSPPDVSLFESVNATDVSSSDNAKSIENKPTEDLFNSIGDTSKQDLFSMSPEVANALVNTLGDDTNKTKVTEQEATTEQ